jgi:hypothetical protein
MHRPTQRQAASIHRRLALGTVSRAARVLQQSPLAPMGAATFEAMRDLHPQQADPLQQRTLAWPTKSVQQVCNVCSAPCPEVQPPV